MSLARFVGVIGSCTEIGPVGRRVARLCSTQRGGPRQSIRLVRGTNITGRQSAYMVMVGVC